MMIRETSRPRTIQAALAAAAGTFSSSDRPALDAQVLLAFALKVDSAWLFAHGDEMMTDGQCQRYASLAGRRAKGEPIAYLTGRKGFYDLEFVVTPAVLIPRPETELLLEEALRLTADKPDGAAADIGAGSGALAVTFAAHRPAGRVYALDISADALNIARLNARRNHTKLRFLQGHLGQPLIERGIQLDLLMANLPYIPTEDLQRLAVGRYEPRLALDGGADGLDCIRALLPQIPKLCRPGAHVLLEIGADQGESLVSLIRDGLGAACDILPDYAGLDRIARFQV